MLRHLLKHFNWFEFIYKKLKFVVVNEGSLGLRINFHDLSGSGVWGSGSKMSRVKVHLRTIVLTSLYTLNSSGATFKFHWCQCELKSIQPILLLRISKTDPSELLRKDSIIELVQMKFLKQLLGVQSQTSRIGVLLETGRVPLMAYALKHCIKNWNRIANLKNCNPLTRTCFLYIKELELAWCENIKLYLDNIGLRCILNGSKKNPENIVFQRNNDIFHQRSFAEISDQSSKLRTYGLIKSEIREEPYLRIVKNIKDRISMTKFRLSNHKLMIETGRHRNMDKTIRICPFCTSVEDEIHFLSKCETFRLIRTDLLSTVEETLNIRNLRHMEGKLLLKFLLEQENIAQLVAKYLTKSMELRDFLIENHRQST